MEDNLYSKVRHLCIVGILWLKCFYTFYYQIPNVPFNLTVEPLIDCDNVINIIWDGKEKEELFSSSEDSVVVE